jgi:4-hydroxybenzoate polyprenyltransferase
MAVSTAGILYEIASVRNRRRMHKSLLLPWRSLRLYQWPKNALIFVPLVLGGKSGDSAAWRVALLGFVALGLVASATYLINDLCDLDDDRQHWSKRNRPLARGDLSIRAGLLMAAVAAVAGGTLAAYLGPRAIAGIAVYVAVTLSYSFALKRLPILDVLILAALFTLRLGLGIALTDVRLSPWLLAFSMFAFLSLSLAKRYTEIASAAKLGTTTLPGRGYLTIDAPLILALGTTSALCGVLIMILYLIEDAFPQKFYANPAWLWFLPPILFLFFGRVWLVAQRGLLHDDPVVFVLKDGASLLLGTLAGIAFAAALW